MAEIRNSSIAIDRVDGMPAIILENQHIGVWDNTLRKYVDTGLKVTPEEDANTVEFYKLSKTSQVPSAPNKIGGYASRTALDAALHNAGWTLQPSSVDEINRFQFVAIYTLEYVRDTTIIDKVVFKQRYNYTYTLLNNNFAPSPVISIDENTNEIVITNPNGTVLKQRFVSTTTVEALMKLIQGLQKQVDKAIYSYKGSNAPSMTTKPVTDWLTDGNGKTITDPEVKAEVFATHVGDIYHHETAGVMYQFAIKEGGNPTNPADYEWSIIRDNAVTEALKQVSDLAGDTVKIFTERPEGLPYKAGDLWLLQVEGKWRYKHCIKSNDASNPTFSEADWIEPYATLEQVESLQKELKQLSGDLKTANDNISDLQSETENIKGAWIESIKDGIISEQERANLKDTSKRIDEEQAQLQSNVDYILGSPYFSDKEGFKATADAVIASGTGSIDKLQKAIADAIADGKITKAEREAVTQAFALYDTTREALLKAIKDAKSEIDKQIPASVQVGGRNLLTNAKKPRRIKGSYSTYILSEPIVEEGDFVVSFDVDVVTPPADGKFLIYLGYLSPFFYVRSVPYIEGKKHYSETLYRDKSRIGERTCQHLYCYSNGGYISADRDDCGEIIVTKMKLERGTVATDWSPAPEDVQAEIDAINANPPRINDKGTWEVYVPSEGKYVDSGRSSKGDNGKAPIVKDGNWWEWDAAKGDYTDTGIKAQGKDGDGGLSANIYRQGEFRTTYQVFDDAGHQLEKPIPISKVIGGVNGYVQYRAEIRKGTRDVTDIAMKNGGNFRWELNGVQKAVGTALFNLGIGEHVDGVDDEVIFVWDDTNASNW